MHPLFRASFALGLLAISGAPAFADPSGFLSLSLGGGHRDQLGLTGDSPLIEGRGTIAIDIAPHWLLQADGVIHNRHYFYPDSGGFNQQYIDLQGAVHLAYRSSENFLVGGFFQQEMDREAQTFEGNTLVETHYRTSFGAEAQLYLDRVTLYGQAGIVRNTIDYGYPLPEIGTFASGEIRYFPTDDIKLDLHGMLAQFSGENMGYQPRRALRIGLGAEYQLPGMPASLFASADHLTTTWADQSDLDYRAVAGIRFNFGSETLLDRDRNGASLDPVQQYPFFGR